MSEKFKKEFKKYSKKYKSLENDLNNLEKVLHITPKGNKSKHWNILKQEGDRYIFKIRMMCRSLKGSDFRIIYYFDGKNINLIFIELYSKGDKEREDEKRIDEFWKMRNKS